MKIIIIPEAHNLEIGRSYTKTLINKNSITKVFLEFPDQYHGVTDILKNVSKGGENPNKIKNIFDNYDHLNNQGNINHTYTALIEEINKNNKFELEQPKLKINNQKLEFNPTKNIKTPSLNDEFLNGQIEVTSWKNHRNIHLEEGGIDKGVANLRDDDILNTQKILSEASKESINLILCGADHAENLAKILSSINNVDVEIHLPRTVTSNPIKPSYGEYTFENTYQIFLDSYQLKALKYTFLSANQKEEDAKYIKKASNWFRLSSLGDDIELRKSDILKKTSLKKTLLRTQIKTLEQNKPNFFERCLISDTELERQENTLTQLKKIKNDLESKEDHFINKTHIYKQQIKNINDEYNALIKTRTLTRNQLSLEGTNYSHITKPINQLQTISNDFDHNFNQLENTITTNDNYSNEIQKEQGELLFNN